MFHIRGISAQGPRPEDHRRAAWWHRTQELVLDGLSHITLLSLGYVFLCLGGWDDVAVEYYGAHSCSSAISQENINRRDHPDLKEDSPDH